MNLIPTESHPRFPELLHLRQLDRIKVNDAARTIVETCADYQEQMMSEGEVANLVSSIPTLSVDDLWLIFFSNYEFDEFETFIEAVDDWAKEAEDKRNG